MSAIKIAISGIGAVGGYYGGMLADHFKDSSEVELFFISRGENLKVIKEKGLKIESGNKVIVANPRMATDKPEEVGEADYLLCCTKSYDLKDNILKLAPLIGKKTVIVPFLNGANITEEIEKILPAQEVWQGCVYIGSRLIEPGLISKFSTKERLFFGSETGNKERQGILLNLFLEAGINAFNPEEITMRIWKKFFMISTAATITSYYNKPIDEVIRDNYDTFKALCLELKNIAFAKGVRLSDDIIDTTIETQRMMPPGSVTSMHYDFIQGRQSEVENLTGYVVREAERLDTPVPLYLKMYNKLAN